MSDFFPSSVAYGPQGSISLGGYSIRALAHEWGTPLYLYDAATVRRQIDRLRRALQREYQGPAQIAYAAKAYFSLGMARHLASTGVGVDVVSLGELSVARQAGFPPDCVHMHGNNKSPDELQAALQWGIQAVVVDSLDELELLEELAERVGRKARIWLRLTPGLVVKTHAYRQTAHPASKFGLPIPDGQAAQAIQKARASRWLQLTGLHTHLGSQLFETLHYRQAVEMLYELAGQESLIPEEISPGGGWGVRYTEDDPQEQVEDWVKEVSQAIQEQCTSRGWPLPRLVLEPGRWLVAQAGVAVYTIGTTKTALDGTRMLAIDGGMADNPRPALYQAPYMARVIPAAGHASSFRPDELHRANVVGKFCESGDQLIQGIALPEARRGDLLVMPVAGAYHLSMASNYNLASRPAALWLEADRVEVLQPREHPEEEGWWVSQG